jgi:hypothetical protein
MNTASGVREVDPFSISVYKSVGQIVRTAKCHYPAVFPGDQQNAARRADLHNAVLRSPTLFAKPRTFTIHGTKVGFVSSEGRIEWNDENRVVNLVKKYFPRRFDELVTTTFTPKKEALRGLKPGELARLGCQIEGAGDVVLIKRVSGHVEKLASQIMGQFI